MYTEGHGVCPSHENSARPVPIQNIKSASVPTASSRNSRPSFHPLHSTNLMHSAPGISLHSTYQVLSAA